MMRKIKNIFLIILFLLFSTTLSFIHAIAAEVDSYIYKEIDKKKEVKIGVYVKESLYSSGSARKQQIRKEREELANELYYESEHEMYKKFSGSFYYDKRIFPQDEIFPILRVCLFENYTGDPYNLPNLPADSSNYRATGYVIYQFISLEEALDLELSNC